MSDHVHMCISISPKYAISNVIGFIKGKNTISIARQFMGKPETLRGKILEPEVISYRPTVGLDEEVIRAYIRELEKEEERYEQLSLGMR
jgi:putative transposase